MARGWPPLELREVLEILKELKFTYKNSTGGHDFYEGVHRGRRCKVTVDPKCRTFGYDLIQSMVKQANCSRKEWYGATERTAKKIHKGKRATKATPAEEEA